MWGLQGRPTTLAVLLVLVLGLAGTARADVGIERASRTTGVPGKRVKLFIYCGGCAPGGFRLPVSLLPAGTSPLRHPCRGTSCASTARNAPAAAPYVPVGIASPPRRPRGFSKLRFRIPAVEPGLYTYVIYCGPCGHSLIGHPERKPAWNRNRLTHAREDREVLKVLPGTEVAPGSWTVAAGTLLRLATAPQLCSCWRTPAPFLKASLPER